MPVEEFPDHEPSPGGQHPGGLAQRLARVGDFAERRDQVRGVEYSVAERELAGVSG
ncbi:hypothetical protein OG417_14555 [Actinoallomurus sp. NBC_01490]|nr:hypothetical protein [Actinoallomurus sp. NBC_01490]